MASFDTDTLINSIRDAATTILQRDVTTVRGFAQDQLAQLAQQAEGIAAMQSAGVFDDNDELRDHFTNQLQEMALNFASTLRGLVAITVERLVTAILGVIGQAISATTGVTLQLPA